MSAPVGVDGLGEGCVQTEVLEVGHPVPIVVVLPNAAPGFIDRQADGRTRAQVVRVEDSIVVVIALGVDAALLVDVRLGERARAGVVAVVHLVTVVVELVTGAAAGVRISVYRRLGAFVVAVVDPVVVRIELLTGTAVEVHIGASRRVGAVIRLIPDTVSVLVGAAFDPSIDAASLDAAIDGTDVAVVAVDANGALGIVAEALGFVAQLANARHAPRAARAVGARLWAVAVHAVAAVGVCPAVQTEMALLVADSLLARLPRGAHAVHAGLGTVAE
jgi:hypothetical protein